MGAPLVLALSLLVAPQQPAGDVSQREIDTALERAVGWLVESGLERSTRQGEQALAIYAAIHGGADPARTEFLELAEAWKEQGFHYTYDTACVICALTEMDADRHFELILRAARTLAEWQEEAGDWGYPRNPDLSNTQYGALGLWKATTVGIDVPASIWQELGERVLAYQQKDGSFTYRPNGGSGTVNMTTAGAGTLALCEQELRKLGGFGAETDRDLIGARARGLESLADFMPAANHRLSWPLYGLYGMERLGAWAGLTHLGPHDWYQRGANKLVRSQRPDGSWGAVTETCFAVLFLARATAGEREGLALTRADDEGTDRSEAPNAWCWLAAEGNGPEVEIGIDRWNWNRLAEVEYPGERGRGPHVRFVEYWLDGACVAVQLVDSGRPIGNRKFKKRLLVRERGAHELELRFHLELPPRARQAKGEQSLQVISSHSMNFVTLWQSKRPPAQLLKADGKQRESLQLAATSSSRIATKAGYHPGSHAARAAFDGDRGTAWLARGRDDQRWLKARLREDRLVGELRIYPALRIPNGKPLHRPRLVELLLDGEQREVLVMPEDGGPAVLRLRPPRALDEILLTVKTLYRSDPEAHFPFGFSEVELGFVQAVNDPK